MQSAYEKKIRQIAKATAGRIRYLAQQNESDPVAIDSHTNNLLRRFLMEAGFDEVVDAIVYADRVAGGFLSAGDEPT